MRIHVYNCLIYTLADLLPVYFIPVILFDFKVTSGHANTFVLFAQIMFLQIIVIYTLFGVKKSCKES